MKIYASILFSLTLLIGQQVLAHSDHDHGPISEAQAISLAAAAAIQLSAKDVGLDIGKLPASWASVPKENISIHKKGNGYYIVSVVNKNSKKTLYVLMSLGGEVYDVNFSGIFEGIK